jgi:hypothetical protein
MNSEYFSQRSWKYAISGELEAQISGNAEQLSTSQEELFFI